MNDADHRSIEYLLDSIEATGYSFELGSRTYQLRNQSEWVQLRRLIADFDAKNIARIAELEADLRAERFERAFD